MSLNWLGVVWRRLRNQLVEVGTALVKFTKTNPLGLLLVLAVIAVSTWLYLKTYYAGNLGFDKRLWDWLDLLLIPVALAVVVWYFERRERSADRNAAETRMKHEQSITNKRNKADRLIAKDRINQQALESCLEYVSEQLISPSSKRLPPLLRTAVIRARVLEVLIWLGDDYERRDLLLRFLRETQLLTGNEKTGENGLFFDAQDLPKLRLSRARLSGVDFKFGDFTGIDFTDADLSGAFFDGAKLANATLVNANLSKARLQEARLDDANLEGADLSGAKLYGASLRKAKLMKVRTDTDLGDQGPTNLDLTRADLTEADLSGTKLANIEFSLVILQDTIVDADALSTKWRLVHDLVNNEKPDRSLKDADLKAAHLNGVFLVGAYLEGADFTDSHLSKAKLMDTTLRNARFQGAVLAEADFTRADFRGTDLRGVNLETAILDLAKLGDTKVDDSPKLDQKWRVVWSILNPLSSHVEESHLAGEEEASSLVDLLAPTRDLKTRDLTGQDLSWADLTEADLRGYILKDVDLSHSIIRKADLRGANLEGADFSDCTCQEVKVTSEQLKLAKNVAPELLAAAEAFSELMEEATA